MKRYPTKKTIMAILANHGDMHARGMHKNLNNLRRKKNTKPISKNAINQHLFTLKKQGKIRVSGTLKVDWNMKPVNIYTIA